MDTHTFLFLCFFPSGICWNDKGVKIVADTSSIGLILPFQTVPSPPLTDCLFSGSLALSSRRRFPCFSGLPLFLLLVLAVLYFYAQPHFFESEFFPELGFLVLVESSVLPKRYFL